MLPAPIRFRQAMPAVSATRSWLGDAVSASLVHGTMVAGLLLGFWDASACVVGILLDNLFAYVVWLFVYLRLRPGYTRETLTKTFVGLSLGIWGYIAMFRAITLSDTAFLAMNFAVLKHVDVLGNLADVAGGLDGDAIAVVFVILAAILLLVSLYFLGEIMLAMPVADLSLIAASVALLRFVDVVYYQRRHSASIDDEKIDDAEKQLSELCLHVFVKGWVGALMMYLFTGTGWSMVWIYLGWSYAYDLLLRPLLWRWLIFDKAPAPSYP
jgi:hypothetical protein